MKAKKLLLSILTSLCFGFSVFALTSCGHSHQWDEIRRTIPTCTNTGAITYICADCEEIKVVVIEAVGHVEVVDKGVEPTCTTSGLTEGKHCLECNEILVAQEVIAAKGHTEIIDAAVDATCTETGLTEGKHCSICNKVLIAQKEIAAKGHNYVDYACSKCNFHYYTEGLEFIMSAFITNENYVVYSYVVYNYHGDELNVIIPAIYNGLPVTSIGDGAFLDYYLLKSIIIPNSVTSIGIEAFNGCMNLKSITIPDSVTSIGYAAFNRCMNLKSITIPNSVTSIEGYTFSGCSSLTNITIPTSVKSIGERAFSGCSSLTSITIPNNVKNIGKRAFCDCSSLKSITIPTSVTSIGEYAFERCSSLTDVYYTGTISQWLAIEGFSYLNRTTIHFEYKG